VSHSAAGRPVRQIHENAFGGKSAIGLREAEPQPCRGGARHKQQDQENGGNGFHFSFIPFLPSTIRVSC